MTKLIVDVSDELMKAVKHKAIDFSNGTLKSYVTAVLEKAVKE